ncbi:MAG: hypothetical protein QG622_1234 [Actinomycetota bacterium]|nr:hypothetical protein [Actinomycetota bacterium]
MQEHRTEQAVTLAAVLVVRDEAEQLPECLAGLRDVVDEIVVYDTGSVDETAEIARAAGARVTQGYWDDDFARARNAGMELTGADWVLVLDADERVSAGPHPDLEGLRRLLAKTPHDVLTVAVRNVYPEEFGGSYQHPGPRLLRREVVRYVGHVHEQPTSRRDGTTGACPTFLLVLDHLGYADPDVVRAKAARNVEIALAELDRPHTDPGILARVLLNAGRGLVVLGRHQEAVDALETVRTLVPGTRRALEATDSLGRLLLAAGMDEIVLVLAEDLRSGGTDPRYCDWLRAQALAQLGGVEEALDLLRGVDLLRDPAGRELDLGQVSEMHALVASLAGQPDEAVRWLARAMARHGRITGRGALLLDFWGARPPSDLAAILSEELTFRGQGGHPGSHLGGRRGGRSVRPVDRITAELASCRAPGPEVAEALASLASPAETGPAETDPVVTAGL